MYLDNLRKAIKDSGLKRHYIAKQMNMQYDTFRRKMNGETPLKVDELLKLCEILKIEIMEVMENGKTS